ARHNSYLHSLPTNQPIAKLVFPKVLELLKSYLTLYILAVQQQQITGLLLYRAQLWSNEDIQGLQENQLDYESDFLENQLNRPKISINSLIEDID
ncbi:4518_t:CDS:2, partial [Gigaspora rosea]